MVDNKMVKQQIQDNENDRQHAMSPNACIEMFCQSALRFFKDANMMILFLNSTLCVSSCIHEIQDFFHLTTVSKPNLHFILSLLLIVQPFAIKYGVIEVFGESKYRSLKSDIPHHQANYSFRFSFSSLRQPKNVYLKVKNGCLS